jgi:hypothetical protein
MKAQSVWGRENPKGLTDGKLNLVDLAFEFWVYRWISGVTANQDMSKLKQVDFDNLQSDFLAGNSWHFPYGSGFDFQALVNQWSVM